jgi:hypothetical protein
MEKPGVVTRASCSVKLEEVTLMLTVWLRSVTVFFTVKAKLTFRKVR